MTRLKLLLVVILFSSVQVVQLKAQTCATGCDLLFTNQGGVINSGDICAPVFGLNTIQGDACLGQEKCLEFNNNFQFNPPETIYIFAWGDDEIDTLSHQDLLNIPEEDKPIIGKIRKVCHSYVQTTCPDLSLLYSISVELLNQNGNCGNNIGSSDIRVLEPLAVDFDIPEFVCVNQMIPITNSSEEGFNADCTPDATYQWDFGNDGSVDRTDMGKTNFNHPGFSTPGTRQFRLTGFQDPQSVCGDSMIVKTVTVLNIPEPKFNIGVGAELQTVTDCQSSNVFVFTPASNACVNVSLPLENISTNRNSTTTFLWSRSPEPGSSFSNGDLTLDNNTINFTAAGTYEVRLTVNDQCAAGLTGQNFACITVIVKEQPQIDIDLNSDLCDGDQLLATINQINDGNLSASDVTTILWTVTKTSTGGGGVPSFTNGNPMLEVNNMPAGTYSVSLSYETICGTAVAGPKSITVIATPSPTIVSDKTSVCPDDQFMITSGITTASSYTWFENGTEISGENSATLNRQVSTPGSYTYQVEVVVNGCPGTSNTVSVIVDSPASIGNVSVDQSSFCNSDPVGFTLEAENVTPSNANLQWQSCIVCDGSDWNDVVGETSSIYNGSNVGTYRVVAESAGCGFNSTPVIISQREAINPLINISGSGDVCANDDVTLTVDTDIAPGTVALSYQWQLNGVNITGATSATFNASAAGNYSVTVGQDGVCAETSPEVTITVSPLPAFNFSADQNSYCSGDQINITFSSTTPALTFAWRVVPNANITLGSTSGSGDILQNIQNSGNGIENLIFRAAANDASTGCTSDSLDIILPVAPTLTLNVPATLDICDGEFFNADITTNVTENITYEITVLNTDPGIGGATNINDTNQNGGYTLSQNLTNSSNVTANATYSIRAVLDNNGVICPSPDYTLTVSVKPTPNLIFDTGVADTVICSGEILNLNFTTNPAGANINYFVIDNPDVEGESNGSGNTISQSLISLNDSLSELVTYQISIAVDGCDGIARDIIAVVNPIPTITLQATQNDTIICGPGSFQSTILAQSTVKNSTFRWLDGSNQTVSSSATLATDIIGNYLVEVTTPDFCVSNRQVEIIRRDLALPEIDTLSISTPNPVACPGDTVLLTVNALGSQSISNYQWFLNNQIIPAATASTFPAVTSGSYSVEVNTDSPCPEVSLAVDVAFPPEPDPEITGLIPALCPEETSLALQAINNQSSASITEYSWSVTPVSFAGFDDPTVANTNLLISDNKTGSDVTLTITLTLTTDDGCDKSVSETLILTSRPIANFGTPPELCESDALLPADASQFADSLLWSVSPSAGVTIDNPMALAPRITFSPNDQRSATQTYSIRQIAFRAGCADTLMRDVVVYPEPMSAFTKNITPDNGCGPVMAQFTNTSTGVNIEYNWDFGNGRTEVGPGPFDVIFEPDTVSRTYIITLETTGNVCGTDVSSDTIFVRPIPKISKLLFGHPIPVCADFPLPINYIVVGQPDSVIFDFGDGSSAIRYDSAGIINHIYRNETMVDSTFNLTVFAISECSSDTVMRDVVVSPNEVSAFYEADTATTCQFTAVRFTSNQFSSSGNQIIWDWGDGEITNDSISVSHVYKTSGTFYPKLIVQNGCNIDTCSLLTDPACGAEITVLGAPTASFSVDEKACDGTPVVFNNQSSNFTISQWSFGMDSTSSERNPGPVLYPMAGNYNVQLQVIDENNCRDTAHLDLVVHPLPVPVIVPVEGPLCERDSLLFLNDSERALSHLWQIRSLGIQNTDDEALIPFPTQGLYNVWLTAYDEANQMGCSDSTVLALSIGEQPVPEFDLEAVAVDCGVTQVVITNNTVVPIPENAFWSWDFDNARTSDEYFTSATEQYVNFDDFEKDVTVTLTVNHVNGCSAILEKTITLPAFREDIILPPGGELICFTPDKAPNEEFRLLYENLDKTSFKMTIYNEWGAEVFGTNDIDEAWDGMYNGRIASVGVYVAKVQFKGCNSQSSRDMNIAICIRNE